MPDIHISRAHTLGLEGARAVAARWIRDAQAEHGLQCEEERGAAQDLVRFRQPGVEGTLTVTGERFELRADLGFLLRGFRQKIAQTVEARLDALLGAPPPRA